MTWIAACSSERGIHQETVVTEEERQKLIDELMAVEQLDSEEHLPYSPTGHLCQRAADEIEQLAERIARMAERITQLEKAVEALVRM
jgi:HAMP domain-containing protein